MSAFLPPPSVAPPSITVHGQGRRLVTPDRVTFHFALSVVAPSVRDAETALVAQRVRLLEALKPLVPPDRPVQSAGLRLAPHHVYEQHRYVFQGFQATESLTLRLPLATDTSRAVLHAVASEMDALQLSIHYAAKDTAAAAAAARTAAVHDAQLKATQLAAADQKLGRLLRLTDTDDEPAFRVQASTVSERAPDDVPPEAIPVTATISAIWELLPALAVS